jgi:hypothetical protein
MNEHLRDFFALIGIVCFLATAILVAWAIFSNLFSKKSEADP